MKKGKRQCFFRTTVCVSERSAHMVVGMTRQKNVLPGFGPALGYTVTYVSLVLLIPLSMLFFKTATLGWEQFWATVTTARALASYRLSFGAAACGALVNSIFGLILAWVLVRYRFPGLKGVDALVDLPFAMPTAVAGIALTTLYSPNGWIGQYLDRIGIKAAYTPLGVVVALIFIGLPFVVRSVQPVLQELDQQYEEAAASLGANRWQIFTRVIFPAILPAWTTGFVLAFARGLGEYGSVVFISGNMPMRTEIAPFLIITKLEQYDYAGATAIAIVILAISFGLLLLINGLQWWSQKQQSLR